MTALMQKTIFFPDMYNIDKKENIVINVKKMNALMTPYVRNPANSCICLGN